MGRAVVAVPGDKVGLGLEVENDSLLLESNEMRGEVFFLNSCFLFLHILPLPIPLLNAGSSYPPCLPMVREKTPTSLVAVLIPRPCESSPVESREQCSEHEQ